MILDPVVFLAVTFFMSFCVGYFGRKLNFNLMTVVLTSLTVNLCLSFIWLFLRRLA